MTRIVRAGDMLDGGRYRIEECIGAGGMAVVYRATDLRLDTHRAVKVIGRDGSGEAAFLQRFLHECEALQRVSSHPNIVTIVDRGQLADDSPYLVMEFIDGHTLGDLPSPVYQGRLPELAQALGGVADALDASAAKGVIHRDVKPGNIMVGPGGHLYLTDFGIAHIADTTRLTTAMTPLTPAYSSPEQVLNHDVDARSDQFSLACVAFELLTGANAFTPSLKRLDGLQPQALDLLDEYGASVMRGFVRALAPDPEARFDSCTAFVDALTSPSPDTSRFAARRHRAEPTWVLGPSLDPSDSLPARLARRLAHREDIEAPGEEPPLLSLLVGHRDAAKISSRLDGYVPPGEEFLVRGDGYVTSADGSGFTILNPGVWWPGWIGQDDQSDKYYPQTILVQRPVDGFDGDIATLAEHHWGLTPKSIRLPTPERFKESHWSFAGYRQARCPHCGERLADLQRVKSEKSQYHAYFCAACASVYSANEVFGGSVGLPTGYALALGVAWPTT